MSTIDYTGVKPEELKMEREPRKSTIIVTHVPTGTRSDASGGDPATPTTHLPARFRRTANLPKEHRAKGMDGYIEANDEAAEGLWRIFGDGAADDLKGKNEYLIALAGDPEALKITFEGAPKKEKATSPSKPATVATNPETGAKTPEGAPEPPAAQPAAPTPPAEPVSEDEVDALLAQIDS